MLGHPCRLMQRRSDRIHRLHRQTLGRATTMELPSLLSKGLSFAMAQLPAQHPSSRLPTMCYGQLGHVAVTGLLVNHRSCW